MSRELCWRRRLALWAAVAVSEYSPAGRFGVPTLETMQTMKPFSSMLYDAIVLASWRILPIVEVSACSRSVTVLLRRRARSPE